MIIVLYPVLPEVFDHIVFELMTGPKYLDLRRINPQKIEDADVLLLEIDLVLHLISWIQVDKIIVCCNELLLITMLFIGLWRKVEMKHA